MPTRLFKPLEQIPALSAEWADVRAWIGDADEDDFEVRLSSAVIVAAIHFNMVADAFATSHKSDRQEVIDAMLDRLGWTDDA